MEESNRPRSTQESMGAQPKEFDIADFFSGGLTDRDAPTLYGLTPGKDLFRLWQEKTGEAELDYAPFLNGMLDAEKEKVKQAFLAKLVGKVSELPEALVVNKAMPFLTGVLDGACFQSSLMLRIVKRDAAGVEATGNGSGTVRGVKIPEINWIEIQHALEASGLRKAYFVAYDGERVSACAVYRDDVFISNHVAECIQFWDSVRHGAAPKGASE